MKKMFIILGVILFLTGCGKYNDKSLIKDISKKVNDSKSYHLIGDLDIYRNEEKFSYDVDSIYKKEFYLASVEAVFWASEVAVAAAGSAAGAGCATGALWAAAFSAAA